MADLNGKEIISPRFKSYIPQDDFVIFSEDDKEYVYDAYGNQVGRGIYKIVSLVQEHNYIIVENFSGERLVVDGSNVMGDKFIDVNHAFDDKFIFYKNEKYGVASVSKGIIIEPKYEYITVIPGTNILDARNENIVDLYNRDLEKIEIDKEYTTENLQNKYLVLQNAEKRIYLNLDGKEINEKEELKLPAYPFKENGKWGFKDINGKILVNPIYEMVGDFNKYGFVAVKKDGKWGSLDSEFKEVSEFKYKFDSNNIVPKFIGKYLIDEEESMYVLDLKQ